MKYTKLRLWIKVGEWGIYQDFVDDKLWLDDIESFIDKLLYDRKKIKRKDMEVYLEKIL